MAKGHAYDDLYARLETKEGEKELYRLARQRDRVGKDVQHLRVLKNENSNVMMMMMMMMMIFYSCLVTLLSNAQCTMKHEKETRHNDER